MLFAWNDMNRDHIAAHGVTPGEAEEVVRGARRPYPMMLDAAKLVVWGATEAGRKLQVIYVLKSPDEVEYGDLSAEDWMSVESEAEVEIVRVIHAMDLTSSMKQQLKRRRR